eukprot:488820-Pyramimonas_sp.AAC.1
MVIPMEILCEDDTDIQATAGTAFTIKPRTSVDVLSVLWILPRPQSNLLSAHADEVRRDPDENRTDIARTLQN